jgi:hypothetical protein
MKLFKFFRRKQMTPELKTSLVLGCLLSRSIHGYAYYNRLISDKESRLIMECEQKLGAYR